MRLILAPESIASAVDLSACGRSPGCPRRSRHAGRLVLARGGGETYAAPARALARADPRRPAAPMWDDVAPSRVVARGAAVVAPRMPPDEDGRRVNTRAETLLDAALSPESGCSRSSTGARRRRLAVLAYHGVDDRERFAHAPRPRSGDREPPSRSSEVLRAFEGRRTLPRRAVLITFDDGHRSVLEVGLPLLRERGLPAVAFVVAGLVDSDRPFWWSRGDRPRAAAAASVSGMPALAPRGRGPCARSACPTSAGAPRSRSCADRARRPAAALAAAHHRGSPDARVGRRRDRQPHVVASRASSRCEDDVVPRRDRGVARAMLTDALGHAPTGLRLPGRRPGRRVRRPTCERSGIGAAFLFDHRLSADAPRATPSRSRGSA